MIKLGCQDSLPNGWKWYKAQECMDVRDGTHDSPKYVANGYPLVTSKNLVDGKIDFSTCTFISKEDHNAISKRSAVDEGDILYAMIGTIGNPVVVEKFQEFSIKNVALFKFNNQNVFNRYILHFLSSTLAVRQFNSHSRGGTQQFVSLGNIRDLQIPLPPLTEQKRIAAILDKADSLRRKNQQAIHLADQFLRAMFLELFGDPVTNPKGWEVKPLGEITEFENGDRSSNYPSGDDIKNTGILFLNTKNIVDGKITFKDTAFITQEKFDSLGRGKLQKDDLVITLRGTLGSCAKFNCDYETGFINAQLMIIRAGERVDSDFLHALLTSDPIQKKLKSIGNGAAVPQLTASQLKLFELYLPPLTEQLKFRDILNKCQKLGKLSNKAQSEELFNSLSQKAFAGEL